MKNYKQKYEAAIEQAKQELEACGSLDCDAARQIFRFFPELKKSEDERIKTNIIKFLRFVRDTHHQYFDECNEAIDWFEKQGQEKLINDISIKEKAHQITTTTGMGNNNRPLGWTTLEEAQQLVEAGLDKNTADMVYSDGYEYPDVLVNSWNECFLATSGRVEEDHTPCWSLGVLLELIPAEITYSDFKPFKLGIFKDDDKHYFIQYYPFDGGVFCEANGHTLVEASINMILYLLNNGFIKHE